MFAELIFCLHTTVWLHKFIVFVSVFFKIWEQAHARIGGGAVGEGENLKQTLHWACYLMQDSIPQPWDHDLSQNQESDA